MLLPRWYVIREWLMLLYFIGVAAALIGAGATVTYGCVRLLKNLMIYLSS